MGGIKWTESEIEYLRENFPMGDTDKICEYLGRKKSSVYDKAHSLNIKKSHEFKSNLLAQRNKKNGRDLTDELLAEIALKYRTRGQFLTKDPSAYSTARRKGLLDKICGHMLVGSFSIPQIVLKNIIKNLITDNFNYNDRSTIKPYEIDIYLPDYKLGFEYNGKGWYLDNNNDKIKQKRCEELGITLIYIVENNRKYESDIKTQLVKKIKLINEITSKNITKTDILECVLPNPYDEVISYDDITNITQKYTSLNEFYEEQNYLYRKLIKMGKHKEFTSHMKRKHELYTIDDIKNTIEKYEYLGDFINDYIKYYAYIKRHKLDFLLKPLKRRK